MEIRRPVEADAAAATACQLACWREAYAGLVPPDRLTAAMADVAAHTERWRSRIRSENERWLAVDQDEVVGFALAGPNHEVDVEVDWQLYAIYVRQAYWGTGLGRRLIKAAIHDHDAVLWVFRDNHRARRFYAAHGFVPDGTEQEEPTFGGVEIRMLRRSTYSG